MATWADCAGCGERPIDFSEGTKELLGKFDMHAFSWGDIYVQQNNPESAKRLNDAGGTSALLSRLRTSVTTGIKGDDEDLADRKAQFGENKFPEPPFESWFAIFFDSFKDLILIILIVAAVVSIIIESIEHPERGWIDGVAIMIAVLIVASVTATNDYQKQLQFRKLSAESKNLVEYRVLRDGKECSVKTHEVVVGDIVIMDMGARLPADGLVIRSTDLKVNQSELTGESDEIHKDASEDPFLLASTTITSGNCVYVVTAVGKRSLQGQIKQEVAAESQDTPLQEKLDLLAQRIGYVGITFAILTFIAMMAIKGTGGVGEYSWQAWTIHSFIYAVTIIVVAIPEGLPLAVTISLAYSTQKMLIDKNLIRQLDACEIMGNATDICTDKTGTLTLNLMTTVELWAGGRKFVFSTSIPEGTPNRPAVLQPTELPAVLKPQLRDHLSINSTAAVVQVKQKSIDEKKDGSNAQFKEEVKGSKTEGAGIKLVNAMGFSYEAIRNGAEQSNRIIKQYAFSSERKMMSTIIRNTGGAGEEAAAAPAAAGVAMPPAPASASSGVRVLTTGGSDMVLSRCTRIATLRADGSGWDFKPATPESISDVISTVITPMAAATLRTIALAYCDYPSIEDVPASVIEVPEVNLTLFAIMGIKDPLRPGVPEAVSIANTAGVKVRMVTGDNIITARAIAEECGIYVKGRKGISGGDDIVMEGPSFRKLTPKQLDMILPRLCVLARSSPKDKMILVKRLNGNLPKNEDEWKVDHPDGDWATQRDILLPGYYDEWKASRTFGRVVHRSVVGVTGDGTNDAPALKAADVGLSMGISGTEVAKDASKIIITDDNFASIVRSIKWGRSVYDNVQCFLQFQLTVNVVALWLTFLSAVMQEDPPLNPIMMLWVNLIMDTMGALALATQRPSDTLLLRKPYASSAFLISYRMWRHILIQGAFQLALLLIIVAIGEERFGINLAFLAENGKHLAGSGNAPRTLDVGYYKSTFIFNMFVFCQIFNEINARCLTSDLFAAWKHLAMDTTFIVVLIVSTGVQAIMVELGGDFTKTTGLIGMHWLYSILLAAITLPLGFIMRLVPVCDKPSDHADFYQVQYDAIQAQKETEPGSPLPSITEKALAASAPSLDPHASVAGMPALPHINTSNHTALTVDAVGVAGTPVRASGESSPAEAVIAPPFSPTFELAMLKGVEASPASHLAKAAGAADGVDGAPPVSHSSSSFASDAPAN